MTEVNTFASNTFSFFGQTANRKVESQMSEDKPEAAKKLASQSWVKEQISFP